MKSFIQYLEFYAQPLFQQEEEVKTELLLENKEWVVSEKSLSDWYGVYTAEELLDLLKQKRINPDWLVKKQMERSSSAEPIRLRGDLISQLNHVKNQRNRNLS